MLRRLTSPGPAAHRRRPARSVAREGAAVRAPAWAGAKMRAKYGTRSLAKRASAEHCARYLAASSWGPFCNAATYTARALHSIAVSTWSRSSWTVSAVLSLTVRIGVIAERYRPVLTGCSASIPWVSYRRPGAYLNETAPASHEARVPSKKPERNFGVRATRARRLRRVRRANCSRCPRASSRRGS